MAVSVFVCAVDCLFGAVNFNHLLSADGTKKIESICCRAVVTRKGRRKEKGGGENGAS